MSKEKTTVQPFGDRVLCRRVPAEDKEIGGIIIPDAAQKKPQKAIVVAVGPGKMLESGKVIPLSVVPGMKVLLPEYGGSEVKIDDVDHLMIREEEIMAVIGQEE